MKNRIRNFILEYSNRWAMKRLSRQEFDLPRPVKDILVLQKAEKPMPLESQKLLSDLFKIRSKQLRFLTLTNELEIEETPQHFILPSKQINFRGILPQRAQEFCLKKPDVLINFFNTPDPLLIHLSINYPKALRLGFTPVDPRINHIIFNFELMDIDLFSIELPKYIKPILAST